MKRQVRLIAALWLAAGMPAFAQNPVPNPGFENWTAGEPDDWITSNVPGLITNVTQTTPPHSGALAALGEVDTVPSGTLAPILASIDALGNGFPVSQLYGGLNFYYKFTQAGSGYFNVSAVVNDTNLQSIGLGLFSTAASAPSFTLVSTPLFYFGVDPATCVILFSIVDSAASSPPMGNSFVVDDVSLTVGVGIDAVEPGAVTVEKITPNPASETATVYYALHRGGDVRFEILDAGGRLQHAFAVPGEITGRHKLDFDVRRLPSGFYLLRMTAPDGISVARFCVAN
jgi:hypothetical protein